MHFFAGECCHVSLEQAVIFNVSQCNIDKLISAERLVRNPAAATLMRTFFAVYPSDKTLVKKNNLSYQLQLLSSKKTCKLNL